MQLIFKYPFIWIFPILLVSAALSYWLYFYKRSDSISKPLSVLLFAIRFLILSLLGLLLLSPLLKAKLKEVRKPHFIVAFDNSRSVSVAMDSSLVLNKLEEFKASISSLLDDDFEVSYYKFGSNVSAYDSLTLTESSTNLSSPIHKLRNEHRHQTVGGMILISDGIFNMGYSPEYQLDNLPFPIYAFGLGDTSTYRDFALNRLLSNDMAFRDDIVPVSVEVRADMFKGNSSEVIFKLNDKEISRQSIVIRNDVEIVPFNFVWKADNVGIQKITIEIIPHPAENNIKNNRATFYTEVIDARQKILIAYQFPHPDVGAIARSIRKSDNYEVDLKSFSELPDLSAYNLLILHGLPQNVGDFDKLKLSIERLGLPVICILNQDVKLNLFNTLNLGVQISNSKLAFDEVQPIVNENFKLFNLEENFLDISYKLPPLTVPNGKFKLSTGTEVMLNQKIGSVSTDYPLLVFNQTDQRTNAVLLGEGVWRWWLTSFGQDGDNKAIDDLFGSIVRLTSMRIQKERFSVQVNKIFRIDEDILLRALLYNSAYQLVNEPEVEMKLINTDSKLEYAYSFGKFASEYKLNIGMLPEGMYSYHAKVKLGKDDFERKGSFVVQNANIELLNTKANFGLLQRLASSSNGNFYSNLQLDSLENDLEKRTDLVNQEVVFLRYSKVLDFFTLLIFIVLLISIEWFIRKYSGIY